MRPNFLSGAGYRLPAACLPMSDVDVQFLTFDGCPLAATARANLEKALADCGMSGYEEIDILDPAVSEDLPGWGSPTILVNGADITGQPKGNSISCRVYSGTERVPETASIVASIESARTIAEQQVVRGSR